MSFSKIINLGDLCISKSALLSSKNLKFHPQRTFRNLRNNKKNAGPNTDLPTNSVATPFQSNNFDASKLQINNIWKPLGFTIVFSTACYGGAAIWEYENMRSHAASMLKKPLSLFRRRTEERSHPYLKEIAKWWSSLSGGEKVFVPICVLNVLVFAAWKLPRCQPFMLKWFCSNPGSNNICLPMLLSTFSHYSTLHLLANMYVLHSFSTGAAQGLGKEQFLGLYLSAGVFSSLTSYLYKMVTKQPGLSLGASGAIMAILGYVCTQYPDTRLGIILIPIFSFSAGTAIKFIMGLDTAGVLLGWKFFDHAAHLGGAAFGMFWALYGHQHVWQKREPLLQLWHSARGAIK
ncbi:presenilins-associated rhomboid-like protein, mitochondrial isoform X2 [Coccinella septempunctata]|uniref:presenilins-associated rhomboid-like protein, mitochondrial isoform X2 n=1 Tax=Coccinella septempunctata TaxID=41139 RepID=UPI001D066245|nr:presenilins-associated rhomboid-like protein, mitochondrial isoform X2 [Coccinella septempunctata]